jgi:hypothetical protein
VSADLTLGSTQVSHVVELPILPPLQFQLSGGT